jgi:hypothetical protein
VEHAGVGAALAMAKHDSRGLPIAFAVAGHHSGLANLKNQGDSDRTPLRERVANNRSVLDDLSAVVPAAISQIELPELPNWLACLRGGEARLSAEMFVRFLFSAVVDADRLCTECFLDPGKRTAGVYDSLATLSHRLDKEIEIVAARPDSASLVNQTRANVLFACQTAAEQAQGVFSLTVPTGGGKTLSAMSFALRHGVRHDLRRVIVVIPYTSIIEQNAKVYATAFPVEYKRGLPKHGLADRVQLCAQALCLEEMLGVDLRVGALFYGTSRRRLGVVFDETLRKSTEQTAQRLHVLLAQQITPRARREPKCKRCSLIGVCMPDAMAAKRSALRYLATASADPDEQGGERGGT